MFNQSIPLSSIDRQRGIDVLITVFGLVLFLSGRSPQYASQLKKLTLVRPSERLMRGNHPIPRLQRGLVLSRTDMNDMTGQAGNKTGHVEN